MLVRKENRYQFTFLNTSNERAALGLPHSGCSGDISDVKAGVITAVNSLFVTQPQYFSLVAGAM